MSFKTYIAYQNLLLNLLLLTKTQLYYVRLLLLLVFRTTGPISNQLTFSIPTRIICSFFCDLDSQQH